MVTKESIDAAVSAHSLSKKLLRDAVATGILIVVVQAWGASASLRIVCARAARNQKS